jgi:hypothetical protein
MSLKKVTFWAIVGICYLFVSRTVGTFFPGIFRSLSVAQVTVLLSFLASLTTVAFFAFFYKDYAGEKQAALKKASVLAIMGASATSLLHMKGLFLVFSGYTFSFLAKPHFVEPILPWASSILILLFFIVFHKDTLHKEKIKLRKATLSAVIGSSFTALLRTLLLFNYLLYGQIRWFSDSPKVTAMVFMPIIAFSFFAVLYFFISFYQDQPFTMGGP